MQAGTPEFRLLCAMLVDRSIAAAARSAGIVPRAFADPWWIRACELLYSERLNRKPSDEVWPLIAAVMKRWLKRERDIAIGFQLVGCREADAHWEFVIRLHRMVRVAERKARKQNIAVYSQTVSASREAEQNRGIAGPGRGV